MANYQKYPRPSVDALFRHFERKSKNYSNTDIQPEKTSLNYNLGPMRSLTQKQYFNERLANVFCLNRKDVKVLNTWLVTVPKDLDEKYHQSFFEETYDFLENKYGRENVISAWVHMDETTPHLHFAFIPVVYDTKKGREKVSAKECVTVADLKKFHTELENYLKSKGIEANILNGATVGGNRTVKELKAEREYTRKNPFGYNFEEKEIIF